MDTVRVLRNEEMRGLVPMPKAIRAIEETYADLGHNRAQLLNRRRLLLPLDKQGMPTWFQLNVITGAVPCHGVAAIRVDAQHCAFPLLGGERGQKFPGGTGTPTNLFTAAGHLLRIQGA